MQLKRENTILLSTLLTAILLNGCTTHQTIKTSEAHLYNNNFGIEENLELDAQIEHEFLTQNKPTEIDYSALDPTLSTELIIDPDAVTLENYIAPEPIITYKYMHSSKFYRENELPKNKLITGNALLD
jgi:hypothetical protein